MDNIIDFKKPLDPKVKELHELGLAIDALILETVGKGFELFEVSGIIAHRLGECVRNLKYPDQGADIIIDIILKKAGLSNG